MTEGQLINCKNEEIIRIGDLILNKNDQEKIAESSSFPLHNGKEVNFAFSSGLYSKESCPKCSKGLIRKYSAIVYLVKDSMRQMFCPAGYFCAECPTVIIDERFIRDEVSKTHRYIRPIGQDNNGCLSIFKEWNDKKTFFCS